MNVTWPVNVMVWLPEIARGPSRKTTQPAAGAVSGQLYVEGTVPVAGMYSAYDPPACATAFSAATKVGMFAVGSVRCAVLTPDCVLFSESVVPDAVEVPCKNPTLAVT